MLILFYLKMTSERSKRRDLLSLSFTDNKNNYGNYGKKNIHRRIFNIFMFSLMTILMIESV